MKQWDRKLRHVIKQHATNNNNNLHVTSTRAPGGDNVVGCGSVEDTRAIEDAVDVETLRCDITIDSCQRRRFGVAMLRPVVAIEKRSESQPKSVGQLFARRLVVFRTLSTTAMDGTQSATRTGTGGDPTSGIAHEGATRCAAVGGYVAWQRIREE